MITSNEKYEQEISESYQDDECIETLQIMDSDTDLQRAIAFTTVLNEVTHRKVSYKDLANIAIRALSDLELYEMTAILNKHQKEKYEASI